MFQITLQGENVWMIFLKSFSACSISLRWLNNKLMQLLNLIPYKSIKYKCHHRWPMTELGICTFSSYIVHYNLICRLYELYLNHFSLCHSLSLSLLAISPMKSMFMWEVVAGASTYVESVASAVRNPACWKSTSEPTPMSVHTFANTATLPSKPKVREQFTNAWKGDL